MDTFLQDLRYGVRVLKKNPAFTAVAVIVLALGIGANSAIFSVINAVLLKPLPFRDPERLVSVHGSTPQFGNIPVSTADYFDWKRRTRTLENISCFAAYGVRNLSGAGGQAEQLRVVFVSADLFPLLGVQPMLGRNFLSNEDQPDHSKVVLLSHGLWQRRFGADRNMVGKTITLDDTPYTVVGIMSPKFQFPITAEGGALPVDFWLPLPMSPKRVADRNTNYLSLIGRVKHGVTLQKAQTEMTLIAKQMEKEYPATNTDNGIVLVPLYEQIVSKSRTMLFILFGTVVVVLLIACANAANLLLARAATRRKEIAIRTALGVGRARMVRQLLTESTLLAVVSGALGLFIGYVGTRLLIVLSPGDIPRLKETALDLPVLGFTFAISILTGLFFGLVPALQLARTDLNESLNESGRGSSSGKGARIRSTLVVSEVALAFLLFIASGLMVKSFIRVLLVEPGLNPTNLLTAELGIPSSKYPNEQKQAAFFQQVIERTKNLPGVKAVGGTTILPMTGGDSSTYFNVVGLPSPPENQLPTASFRYVTPGYFRAMGILLLKGRDFTYRDDAKTPKVMVINQKMAEKYWKDKNPIGLQLNIRMFTETIVYEIVGIVGNVKHFGLDQDVQPEMYMSFFQTPDFFMYLVARTTSDPMALEKLIQREVAMIDKAQPVANIKTMETFLSESVAPRRFSVFLITVFAGIALVLSAIGIYSVISYSVAQRRNEMGIRMALGAQARDILKLVVGQGFRLILTGIAIGLAGAFAVTRLLTSFLFHVSARDPFIFIGISLVLPFVALLASYIPARKATKVDPMAALRYE
jgi:putative ABC transport system permease protein